MSTLEKIWVALASYTLKDIRASIPLLVKILTTSGRRLGISGILRHYKWREVAMAEILGHEVNPKTSTGDGGDAVDSNGRLVEYKTGKISLKSFEKEKMRRHLKFSMVYNGAYGQARIKPYLKVEHYFGLFDEETEECLLIYHADTEFVVNILLKNDTTRASGATTNLNTVQLDVDPGDKRIVYWSPSLL